MYMDLFHRDDIDAKEEETLTSFTLKLYAEKSGFCTVTSI
jgi:hypothetical protein